MSTAAKPNSPKKRSSLRLPPQDHRWWTNEIRRVQKAEGLTQFSLSAAMHRIATADLDLTQAAIQQYRRPK